MGRKVCRRVATVGNHLLSFAATMLTALNNPSGVCINCGNPTITEIRRDELFGSGANAVIIENIPMMKCHHCGMVYLEPKVSRMIDEICAHPQQDSSIKEKLVAEYV